MTKDEIDTVIKAYKEGKKIEWFAGYLGDWFVHNEEKFDFEKTRYRVADQDNKDIACY